MSNAIRIGHLIKGLGRGGAEGLLPQVVRASEGGFEFRVAYFLPWKDALVEELRQAGVAVESFPCRSEAALLLKPPVVARWLTSQRIQILHCHLPLAGVVGRLAGRLAGVPVVYTEHNLQQRYHPWTRRANRWTWRWQEEVVAVSREVAESIASAMGSAVRVRVVRNGIDVQRLAPDPRARAATRARLGIPEGAPVLGTAAVLRAQKRLDLWLEAAREVAAALPEARFLVVGDGPLRADLEEAVASLGLARRVLFVGLQEDVAPFLAAMDLFLMSSQFEGLPLALLEAMAMELPVVATAVGGIPEAVANGREGLLVPYGEPSDLAAAALGLLRDPERARSLGVAARHRVERDFAVARMAAEIECVYREVLARRSRSREPAAETR